MFRFVSPSAGAASAPLASTSNSTSTGRTRSQRTRRADDDEDEDMNMLDDDATSPGAVTGPGEVIADAQRWMRSVESIRTRRGQL